MVVCVWEDTSWVVDPRRTAGGLLLNNFFFLKMNELRVGVTYYIRNSTIWIQEGFHSPVVQVLSDQKSFWQKGVNDKASNQMLFYRSTDVITTRQNVAHFRIICFEGWHQFVLTRSKNRRLVCENYFNMTEWKRLDRRESEPRDYEICTDPIRSLHRSTYRRFGTDEMVISILKH